MGYGESDGDSEGVSFDDAPVDEDLVSPDEEGEPAPARFEYNEDDDNLVGTFHEHEEGRKFLEKFVTARLDEIETGAKNAEPYRERQADNWLIFTGDLPDKEYPFEDCANTHVPIMMENITRLVFRASGELFSDLSHVVNVQPTGPDDEEDAQLLTKHINWQLSNKIPDFYREQERGLLMFYLQGDVTCHSYYDHARGHGRHTMLNTDELIVPYIFTSTMPDWSDCPWICKVLRMYRHEVEGKRGAWYDPAVDKVLNHEEPGWDNDAPSETRERQEEFEGISYEASTTAPYVLYHWEGWAKLPRESRQRYVQCIIDTGTKNIVHLSIHEEPSWTERARFKAEEEELESFRLAVEAWETNGGMAIDPETQEPIQVEAPLPPEWVEDEAFPEPTPMKKYPIHMFSHAVCIENLAGNLGLGFGSPQADYNRMANTALAQFTDQATLANTPGWLINANLNFQRPFTAAPGQMNFVTGTTSEDMMKGVQAMRSPQANPQMLELVEMAQKYGQSSMQAPSVLSGEPGKSGETFRGISTRVEQATKQLQVTTRKYAHMLERVVENQARINAHFMKAAELFGVLNHKLGVVESLSVGPQLYEKGYNWSVRADMKYASSAQKIADADLLVQAGATHPYLQQNAAFNYEALRKSLEARDLHDMVPMLGPKPARPEVFQPALPPEGEPPPGQGNGAVGAPPQGT